ncbi:unnamed protein product [Spirodela intermedia]|uniref:50S ribosomal protein L17, chloroplastic n=1 Tax=Spirodela intermedia TaxID=51605 RepID=A0ABN7ECY5_SPIIN|nr:unnamed protein product [Spirodela intermedia]
MAAMATSLSPWSMASLRAALPSSSSSQPPHFRLPATAPSLPSSSRLGLSRRKQLTPLRSYSGLSTLNTLFSIGSDAAECDQAFINVDNGSKFYAMRHGRRVPKLNRPPDQRRALLRCLTTQLLKYGRIKTTRARASAMRNMRQALGFIYEKQIVHALFAEVPGRYGERNGGYTRIIRTLPRRGDNAPMAYIELV